MASRADVANQIESKKGAYRNNFDEGHFYFLEDFLPLNFSGKVFTSLKAKVKAVNSLKHEVRRTPDGQLGVNVSTLPAMAAYKYQSGESETFAKVTVDELSDAEEAEEFLDQAIRDSDIISHPLAKVGVDDEADDDDASSDLQQQHQQAEHPDDAATASDSDDGIVGSGSATVATFKSEQTFALNRSLGPGIKIKHRSPCPSPSRSARNSSRPRSSGQASRSSVAMATPAKNQTLKERPAFARSLDRKATCLSIGDTEKENDTDAGDTQKQTSSEVPRRKIVQTLPEAQQVFEEYSDTFSAASMYENKPKSREITAGVDRLKKIGNRVACLEGDEAADLAGNLVTLADQIRPLWEMMDCLRREPETFLHKIKEEWVALFMALPTSLKKELLSNIALSVLGKLASSTSNAEDVLAAARIISGSGAFEVGGEGQQRNIHLGFISLADGFEKIQSHLLVVVMEALMKLSKAEYVKIIRELRAQGLAPTLDDHISAKKDVERSKLA